MAEIWCCWYWWQWQRDNGDKVGNVKVKLTMEGWWKQGEAHSSTYMMAEEVAPFATVEAANGKCTSIITWEMMLMVVTVVAVTAQRVEVLV